MIASPSAEVSAQRNISAERLGAEARSAPEQADIWVRLAIAEGRRKRFTPAVAALSRARALRPADPAIHHVLGRMLFQISQFRRAEVAFTAAIAFQHDHAEAYFYLGRSLGSQRRFSDALHALKRAVFLAPFWPAPASFSGTCHFLLNRHDEAARQFLRAIALDPKAADVHLIYGRALLRAGNRAIAEAQLARAVDLKPTLAKSREFLLLTLCVADMKEDLRSG
ncbi:MAG: tetratricopeptide repeat protein [Alphaproteobacteria bacterium]|nr:tetratricopeptide repeat protein [Alphaproteobacteria bacterium]